MKRLYTYLTILTLGLVNICSCTDEIEVYNYNDVEEGNDVVLNLNIKAQANNNVAVSRATDTENELHDLHVYVFNSSGKLTGYAKKSSEDASLPVQGNVSINTKSGSAYIYAVGNINDKRTYFLSSKDSTLLNVTDVETSKLHRDSLPKIRFQRQYSRNTSENFSPSPSDGVFMMSGYLNDGASVTIQNRDGIGTLVEEDDTIRLYRILAKNTLAIVSDTTKGKFTPKSYRLCNVPKSGVLFPKAGISNANINASYTTNNTDTAQVESSHTSNFERGDTITFHFPENLPFPKQGVNISKWKEREADTYAVGTKGFTNAPDSAAYIEIQGDYINKSGQLTANVSYTIHLGNFSKSLTDFNVIRNNHYKYTVKVNGVNDIIAEAVVDSVNNTINKDSINPYVEGLVINATNGKHYDVDAHYEARVLSFKKDSILALKGANNNAGTGYILNIKTPFGQTRETVNVRSNGVYNMQGVMLCTIAQASDTTVNNPLFDGEADFRWIKFVRNGAPKVNPQTGVDIDKSTNVILGSASTHVCKYPGDENTYSSSNNKTGGWMNVFELLAELYNTDTGSNIYDASGGTVYYTCFIDENYYPRKKWTEYVNKDRRTILIANELSVSEDGKSLYAEVEYSISQRSISTFYNLNAQNALIKAFGTEIIDEEKKYNKRFTNDDYFGISEQNNGWISAKNTNVKTTPWKWYASSTANNKTIEMVDVPGVQPLYGAVAKACMSRNRDLNGNENIDENEVRWYLADINQYRALMIGQNSLDKDAYLITQDTLRALSDHYEKNGWGNEPNSNNRDENGHYYRGKYHYFTSTSKSTENAVTFWPEEGLTNNPTRTRNQHGWTSRAELVRCVRTLQSGTQDNPRYGVTNSDLYYTYANNEFTLNGITATRTSVPGALPVHNEVDDANNLYNGFVVAEYNLELKNSNNNWVSTFSFANILNSTEDYCSRYSTQNRYVSENEKGYVWRTPNQKEMAIMVQQITALQSGDWATRTKFSGNDAARGYYNWHTREGFWLSSKTINVTDAENRSLQIRCVRDK